VSVENREKSSNQEAFDLIERMLKLMDERGLLELEVEQAGVRIRLKKQGQLPPAPVAAYPQPVIHTVATAVAAQPAPGAEPTHQEVIKSPMVGTFYASPAPDAPSFVEEGQEIQEGQVVCIIEAMKLMNEIKAECSGRIAKIMVKNGEPVEYGQSLFLIDPA
jgi:acetyl-CoA carboxylase biotin carboxyl carrier protein